MAETTEHKLGDSGAVLQLTKSLDGRHLTIRMLKDGRFIEGTVNAVGIELIQESIAEIELTKAKKKKAKPRVRASLL